MLMDEKPTARTPKTQRLTPHEKAKKTCYLQYVDSGRYKPSLDKSY